jgi:hypothetical protein
VDERLLLIYSVVFLRPVAAMDQFAYSESVNCSEGPPARAVLERDGWPWGESADHDDRAPQDPTSRWRISRKLIPGVEKYRFPTGSKDSGEVLPHK